MICRNAGPRGLRTGVELTYKDAGHCIRNFFILPPQILPPPHYPTSSSTLHMHTFNVPFRARVCCFFATPCNPFSCTPSFIQCIDNQSEHSYELNSRQESLHPRKASTSAVANIPIAAQQHRDERPRISFSYILSKTVSFGVTHFEFGVIFDEWNSSVLVAITRIRSNSEWLHQACRFPQKTSALL
jgi:hypothetical protein